MVTPAGFEPATSSLGETRAIQLCHGALQQLPVKDTGVGLVSKEKKVVKKGRIKSFSGALPPGIKPSQAVSLAAGVTLRTDGQLRWEARIRRSLDGQALKFPLKRYPVDPKAKAGTEHHIDTARLMAEAYVSREHASLELRQTPFANTADAWTFGDLLRRYVDEIDSGVINHSSLKTDRSNIMLFLGTGKGLGLHKTGMPLLTSKLAKDLTSDDFLGKHPTSFVNLYVKVLKDGSVREIVPGSKKRALTTIQTIFKHAYDAWKIDIRSPIATLKSLNQDDSRSRTLAEDEWNSIIDRLEKGRTDPATIDVIRFARFTAARRSECIKLDWSDINFKNKTARLRGTKANDGKYVERTIPLNKDALSLLEERHKSSSEKRGPVFVSSRGKRSRPDTITQAWDRARSDVATSQDNPDILTARIHDLRHTRITELGHYLNPAEAAKISGHKDLKMFMRYFNPDPVELGKKIDELESRGDVETSIQEVVRSLLLLSSEDMTAAISLAFNARMKSK